MKKKVILAAVMLSVISTAYFTALGGREKYDFRRTRWNMSMEEVKASEKNSGAILLKDDDIIFPGMFGYDAMIFGLSCRLEYSFYYDHLISAIYSIEEKYTDGKELLAEFNKFRDNLTSKYGKPVSDKTNWKKGIPKTSNLEKAIIDGNVTITTEWQTNTTKIIAKLNHSYTSSFWIVYHNKNAEEVMELIEKEKL